MKVTGGIINTRQPICSPMATQKTTRQRRSLLILPNALIAHFHQLSFLSLLVVYSAPFAASPALSHARNLQHMGAEPVGFAGKSFLKNWGPSLGSPRPCNGAGAGTFSNPVLGPGNPELHSAISILLYNHAMKGTRGHVCYPPKGAYCPTTTCVSMPGTSILT
jgi:hypothetical protein